MDHSSVYDLLHSNDGGSLFRWLKKNLLSTYEFSSTLSGSKEAVD
ncbi:hypothetical protein WANA31_0477 [Wolbachia endosymbiont of Drosophila ananassae]|nr:hypothetical protein WANA31_0477 [Wolbachia endosymbiont of Drosophila ananassae]RLT62405.1 hypothetical protein WANA34_0389 [Wolbachia endosymbiont of Drosophila ananassae]RLT62684.1 hypothetical protein WANA13_0052 [Wolbachia endosymbiont of Drosophila ananassae]